MKRRKLRLDSDFHDWLERVPRTPDEQSAAKLKAELIDHVRELGIDPEKTTAGELWERLGRPER